ncbi:hypothetical protein ACFIQF_19700 [Comamonas sp. J-3]|uniref:hypothetical protein n=1 Tax=Comamonas trifloxystrobinivorans TaxID=3350256 RepID=UPI0037293A0F
MPKIYAQSLIAITSTMLLNGCIQTIPNADGTTTLRVGPAATMRQEASAPHPAPASNPVPVNNPPAQPAAAAEVTAPKAKTSTKQVLDGVDWTPLFKGMEKGCESSTALNALREQIERTRESKESGSKRFTSAFNINNVARPYRTAVDKKVAITQSSDSLLFTLPVKKGSYYGMPVNNIFSYQGLENGINGYGLVLDISPDQARKQLSAIRFRSSIDGCSESKMEIKPIRINSKPMTRMVCDSSC